MSAIGKEYKKYCEDNNGERPNLVKIGNFVARNFPQDAWNEDGSQNFDEADLKLAVWYVDVILKETAGHKNGFPEEIRHHKPISEGFLDKAGKNVAIPPSTEAFALTALENAADRWYNVYLWKQKPENKHRSALYKSNKDLNETEIAKYKALGYVFNEEGYGTVWSDSQVTDVNKKRFMGWKDAGIARFTELKTLCAQGRYDLEASGRPAREESLRWEKLILGEIQKTHQVSGQDAAAQKPEKKRKRPNQNAGGRASIGMDDF